MPRERFYVTTPIYYVNDAPHVGHAYTTVLADVLAGYHRMLGVPTWLLTGTDEHGQKAQLSAEARGITPQALCDEMSQNYRDLHARLGIAYDDFIRTTEERHVRVVVRALERLWEQGDIYRSDYAGWYCTRCERFWADNEVAAAGGRCPDQPELHEVGRLSEPNYFFRMSNYAEELRRRIESDELRITPEKRRNEVLGFLRQGVGDLCISRSRERLHWGVPLPFDPDYVTYVWVDALLNYESAVGFLSDDPARRADHARWWPCDLHLIGKDILTTHSVYWPTLLLALGEPLPRRILAHGWLLDPSGIKLSKTKRAGGAEERPSRPPPTIEAMLDVLGRDVTRWFLATAMKPGDDAYFNWDIVRERVNAELANGLGNSVNRVLRMAHQSAGGRLPPRGEPTEGDLVVRRAAEEAVDAARQVPDTLDVLAVTGAVRDAVQQVSLYLDAERPWKAAKDPANLPRVGAVLSTCIEALRLLGLALTPVLPEKCAELRRACGMEGPLHFEREARFGFLPEGTALGEPPGLFPRLEEGDLPQLPGGPEQG